MSSRIAIVGMACIFPGADNPARFWQNILSGADQVASLGGLGLEVVLAVVCIVAAPPTRPRITTRHEGTAAPAAAVPV